MIAQIEKIYISIRPQKALARIVSYALFEGRPLTTRGQWVNPLLLFLFKIFKKIPQIKQIRKPIYIIGTGRSGTTILGLLLSIHRDVGFLNEPKALWHSIYPKEDLIGSYSRGEAFYSLEAKDVDDTVVTSAHRLYAAYLTAVCSSRVVDKYPELIFRIPFIKKIFPDAKFIFLIRNGWDTCHSIQKWSTRLGALEGKEIHDWWGANQRKWKFINEQLIPYDIDFRNIAHIVRDFTDHLNMAMVEWIITMRQGLKMKKAYPNDIYTIRFEDLTYKPKETLKKITTFCELSDDQKMISYAQKVLVPARKHSQINLEPSIYPLFKSTMKSFGYKL